MKENLVFYGWNFLFKEVTAGNPPREQCELCGEGAPSSIAANSAVLFKSPSYPSYPTDTKSCSKNITVPAGSTIMAYALDLNFQGSQAYVINTLLNFQLTLMSLSYFLLYLIHFPEQIAALLQTIWMFQTEPRKPATAVLSTMPHSFSRLDQTGSIWIICLRTP